MQTAVNVYRGAALAGYGFGADHPFGPDRHDVFHAELESAALGAAVHYAEPQKAADSDLRLFHSPDYVEFVARRSKEGTGYLDGGDTPVVPGIFEAAATVVGSTLAAVDAVMSGAARRGFVPIGGLHHAARDRAAGFCVFNDCGVAIEHLRVHHGLSRVAYVDIDAHHGDGVFYGFENDPNVPFADVHEDGRFLYPGTGAASETGIGPAAGTKLNVPLAPGADDQAFFWRLARNRGTYCRRPPGVHHSPVRSRQSRGGSDYSPAIHRQGTCARRPEALRPGGPPLPRANRCCRRRGLQPT